MIIKIHMANKKDPAENRQDLLQIGQYRIILSADTASEVRQMPERCLSRKAGIMRCCLSFLRILGILFGGFGAPFQIHPRIGG